MKKKIKQLLDDLDIVNASLNSTSFNSSSVETTRIMIIAKMKIESELKNYSDDEIEEVRKPTRKIKKLVAVEDIEIVKKEEQGILYYLLVILILNSDRKNKAFLMIAVELFAKETTYKKIYTTRYI